MNLYNLNLVKLTDAELELLTNSETTREVTVRKQGTLLSAMHMAMANFPEVYSGKYDIYYINVFSTGKLKDYRDSVMMQFFFRKVR